MELQYEDGLRTATIEFVYSDDEFDAKRKANPDIILANVCFQAGFRIEDQFCFRDSAQVDRWRAMYGGSDELVCSEDFLGPGGAPDYTKTEKWLHVEGEVKYWFSYNAAGFCTEVHDAEDARAKIFPLEPRPGRPLFDWSQLSYFRFAYPFVPEGSETIIFSTWQDFLTRSSS